MSPKLLIPICYSQYRSRIQEDQEEHSAWEEEGRMTGRLMDMRTIIHGTVNDIMEAMMEEHGRTRNN
jgi:hypothetical protein